MIALVGTSRTTVWRSSSSTATALCAARHTPVICRTMARRTTAGRTVRRDEPVQTAPSLPSAIPSAPPTYNPNEWVAPVDYVYTGDYSWLVNQPALVIKRQIELLNVFVGWEQANRYAVKIHTGQSIAFIAEETSMARTLGRQFLGLHRAFKATVLDAFGNPLLRISRPYYLINSTTQVIDSNNNVIGEVHQRWHPWRRRYNLFIDKRQFGEVDAPFLSMVFEVKNEHGEVVAVVDRNFVGFAREIFTDTGEYVLHFTPPPRAELSSSSDAVTFVERQPSTFLTLEQRAVLIALAVSCDFDYFSRHSGSGVGWFAFLAFLLGRDSI